MLVRNLPVGQPFRVVSFANPHASMSAPPDGRYVAVPGRGRASSALGLVASLVRESWFRRALVHFVMPAHYQRFVALLTWLCHVRGVPTIFTVTKRTARALAFANVSIVVAQTRAAHEELTRLLPGREVRLVVPGSAETVEPEPAPRGKKVLFVGVPWSDRDLQRRGVFMFFEVVRRTLELDPDVRFTLLNRAQSQVALLDRLAAELPPGALDVRHGSSDRMSEWYGKHSAFLVLHLDGACPDPPLSAVEASCCGCAVVTTRFNGLAPELTEAGAGVEVAATPEAIARGIVEVLRDEARFRAGAFELGRTRFGEQAFFRAYQELYARAEGP
jgi:glycosyltransferase involved in cell wall biosynthesis